MHCINRPIRKEGHGTRLSTINETEQSFRHQNLSSRNNCPQANRATAAKQTSLHIMTVLGSVANTVYANERKMYTKADYMIL